MKKEIYKDIPGYKGVYQVSNFGNIKSVERRVRHVMGGEKVIREKVLKLVMSPNKYLTVCLYKNGVKGTKRVHSLVAETFLNHVSNGYYIHVDHIDGDKKNNKVNNLQILTARNNTIKFYSSKTHSSKYIGICWHKISKKWQASIHIDGRKKYLGLFKKEIDAHNVYQKELKKVS